MKRNLLILTAVGAIALGGFTVAQAQGHGRCHGQSLSLEYLTKTYNLTAEQQAKIKPLLDQAKPQIAAIHKEAMQRVQTVVSSTTSQIRPLLNSNQQAQLDAIQKANADMQNAKQEMKSAASR
jgi:hypothetical protein